MTADDLFAAAAVAVVLIGVAVAVTLARRSGRKRFESLAPAFDFGTARKVGFFGLTVAGLHNGYSCRYTIQPASQHNPGGATLRVDVSAAGRWSAEVANFGSRLMVKMGLIRDLDVGDPDLDTRLRFSADDEGSLRTLFGVDDVRRAVRSVMATENFAGVGLGKQGLAVSWSPRDRRLDEDAETVRQRLEAARGLASACGYPPGTSF